MQHEVYCPPKPLFLNSTRYLKLFDVDVSLRHANASKSKKPCDVSKYETKNHIRKLIFQFPIKINFK